MKLTPFILTASLFTLLPAFADDAKPEVKPAAPAALANPLSESDKAWSEVDALIKEDMRALVKKHLTEFDAKIAAFKKAYPEDARRWKLAFGEAQKNNMRGMGGMPGKKPEEIQKILGDIIAAADADIETKGSASALRVRMGATDDTKFEALAKVHIAAYPDNAETKGFIKQVKRIETQRAVAADQKVNPLSLKFTAVDGTEVDVEKMRGKVILVDFWATWCGPCVAEIPNVVAAYTKLHDQGFEIVGISFDTDKDKEKMVKFTKEKQMPWPQFYDGKYWESSIGERFGIGSLPTMWLVNKKGMVVDTNPREGLAKKIEKLLAE
jgi:thiol-disulfide isomerase/thioredoxin